MGKSLRYYEILKKYGLSENASEEEIHTFFRRKLKETHPDVNESAGAEEKFKEINNDFLTLKKESIRQQETTKKSGEKTTTSNQNSETQSKEFIDWENLQLAKAILVKYQHNEFIGSNITALLLNLEKINEQNYLDLVKEIITNIAFAYLFNYNFDRRAEKLFDCKDLKTLIKECQLIDATMKYENAEQVYVNKNKLYKLREILVRYSNDLNPSIKSIVELLLPRVRNAINKDNAKLNKNDVEQLKKLIQLLIRKIYDNRLISIFEKSGNLSSDEDKLKFESLKKMIEDLPNCEDLNKLIDFIDKFDGEYIQVLTPNQVKTLNKILNEHQKSLEAESVNSLQEIIVEFDQKQVYDFSSYMRLKLVLEAIIAQEMKLARLKSEDLNIYNNYLGKITNSAKIKDLITYMLAYDKDLLKKKRNAVKQKHQLIDFSKITNLISDIFKKK